jgi:hypothetical protein
LPFSLEEALSGAARFKPSGPTEGGEPAALKCKNSKVTKSYDEQNTPGKSSSRIRRTSAFEDEVVFPSRMGTLAQAVLRRGSVEVLDSKSIQAKFVPVVEKAQTVCPTFLLNASHRCSLHCHFKSKDGT